jgi:hypothetical protein
MYNEISGGLGRAKWRKLIRLLLKFLLGRLLLILIELKLLFEHRVLKKIPFFCERAVHKNICQAYLVHLKRENIGTLRAHLFGGRCVHLVYLKCENIGTLRAHLFGGKCVPNSI